MSKLGGGRKNKKMRRILGAWAYETRPHQNPPRTLIPGKLKLTSPRRPKTGQGNFLQSRQPLMGFPNVTATRA